MSNRGNIRRRGRGPRGAGRGRGGRILTTTQERSDPELLEIEKKVNQTFNEAHHKLKNISSIIDAVRKDDFPRFQSLVNQAQTYINELSINGDSILVEACRFGRAEMFDFLMNQTKININLASQNKKQQRFLTPLMAAIMTLDISFVKKLLYESNREVDVAKVCGQPLQANAPMLCVIYSVCNGYKQEHASKALEILEILLEYAKKKEKLKDLFNKSLFFHDSKLVHAAAMASNFEALSLLRRYGARLDIYNQRGLTPINLAESNVLQKRNFLLRPMKKQKKKQNKGKKHNQNKNKNKSNTTTDRDIKETIENQKEEVEEEEIEGLADICHRRFSQSRLDRRLEVYHITRTMVVFAEEFGYGPLFTRRGTQNILSPMFKDHLVAFTGLIPILNEIAINPCSEEKRKVYIDGIVYNMTRFYSMTLNDPASLRVLWKNALTQGVISMTADPINSNNKQNKSKNRRKKNKKNTKAAEQDQENSAELIEKDLKNEMIVISEKEKQKLSRTAFKMIMSCLLSHRSLSRRIKAWAVILAKLLDLYPDIKNKGKEPYNNNIKLITPKEPAFPDLHQLEFYRSIAQCIYRSGSRLLFSIYDRRDIDDDSSYDEEIEYRLVISFVELFFQFYLPHAKRLAFENSANIISSAPINPILAAFQQTIAPIKQLWPLLLSGLDILEETISTPQRFAVVIQILQLFEQVEETIAQQHQTVEKTLDQLYQVVKTFVQKEATKKHDDTHQFGSEVQLIKALVSKTTHSTHYVNQLLPLKSKIEVLIRSDPKILGPNFADICRLGGNDFVRLENKLEYLEELSQESDERIQLTITRTSCLNFVEFILLQLQTLGTKSFRGELKLYLANEPGIGIGVTREFFQLVSRFFFHPSFFMDSLKIEEEEHSAQIKASAQEQQDDEKPFKSIGSQWLQLARNNKQQHEKTQEGDGSPSAPRPRGSGMPGSAGLARLWPIFAFVNENSHVLHLVHHPIFVVDNVLELRQQEKEKEGLTHWFLKERDLFLDPFRRGELYGVYRSVGRLLGLSIRHHQPMGVYFPIAFWKFILEQTPTWQEYCKEDTLLERSLQYILDHDFSARPLDLKFQYTTNVIVKKTEDFITDILENSAENNKILSVEVELVADKGKIAVSNANKQEYVALRAERFFFGNDKENYAKIREGIRDVIHRNDLKLLSAKELQDIVLGKCEIDIKSLKKVVIYTRNTSEMDETVEKFWQVVETFDQTQLGTLLAFWSGSSMPPLFGFESNYESYTSLDSCRWYIEVDLNAKVTQCPQANTCDRRLILPPYPTKEMLRSKLHIALEYGAAGYDRM